MQHGSGGYTASPRLGQKAARSRISHARVNVSVQGSLMSRPLIALIVILVVVVGALFVLAGRTNEKPLTRVEKVVPLANLSN